MFDSSRKNFKLQVKKHLLVIRWRYDLSDFLRKSAEEHQFFVYRANGTKRADLNRITPNCDITVACWIRDREKKVSLSALFRDNIKIFLRRHLCNISDDPCHDVYSFWDAFQILTEINRYECWFVTSVFGKLIMSMNYLELESALREDFRSVTKFVSHRNDLIPKAVPFQKKIYLYYIGSVIYGNFLILGHLQHLW